MMIRSLVMLLGVVVLPSALSASVAFADQAKPNVLFLAVDDLNDWIGCLDGHPQGLSPHIDQLAGRGVLFHRSYCAAPACNPSRAALLTGIRPWNSGVYLNPQPWRPAMKEAVTLPQLFRRNGYHVVGGGKIFHGRYPDDASWDYYFKKKADPKPTAEVRKDRHSRAGGIVWGALDVADSEMNDYQVATWAAKFLAQKHDKPFFLACGIFRPHMPWQVPRKYYDMFPLDKIQLPKTLSDDLSDIPTAGKRMARPEGDHAKILNTDNWKHAVQAYLASIAFADSQIGRVIKALDDSEYAQNTIIVLWGDHGWHLGEKQHWRKFSLWEEAARAPLMIVAPGLTKANSHCHRTVDFMDLYPTLADICKLPVGEHLDGRSMRSLLSNPMAPWDRPAITTHGRDNHAVRSERFRYIRYQDGSEELYDHEKDAMEWNNLADDPQFADAKAKLAKWLPKHSAENAPFDQSKRPKPRK
jgi:arylsulfatase A-like enzyme